MRQVRRSAFGRLNRVETWRRAARAVARTALAAFTLFAVAQSPAAAESPPQRPLPSPWVDLTLLVSPRLPAFWPVGGLTPYARIERHRIGPQIAARDLLLIDEHTGTQWDAPAHFVPPPDSGLPGAGAMGLVTSEKVPVWQFVGRACVIDLQERVDDARPGESHLIRPDVVLEWEKRHHKLGPGDVVLFRSDYTDRYYRPFPEGRRFVEEPLAGKTPGWPGPTPDTMKLLGERQVHATGIDSASMGPLPDLAVATHQAGGQYGLIWAECLTNLKSLPPTGAFYALLPAKHRGGSGGETRAVAVLEPELAKRLNRAAKARRVVDLSLLLDDDLPTVWTGDGPGDEGTRYLGKTLNAFDPAYGPFFARTHTLDSHAGTHLVPPACWLPPPGFSNDAYSPEVRGWLADYEQKFGPRGFSTQTADQVPLDRLVGPLRLIDVRSLADSTDARQWPASPSITVDHLRDYEARHGAVRPGDVVAFWSGYSDRHYKPLPDGKRYLADPLAGKAEAWPAPTPELIVELAKRRVSCVATDGPVLGSVRRSAAAPVYWAAASRGLPIVEGLTNLAALADAKSPYFLFAPVKLEGCHGGYGRAIALHGLDE